MGFSAAPAFSFRWMSILERRRNTFGHKSVRVMTDVLDERIHRSHKCRINPCKMFLNQAEKTSGPSWCCNFLTERFQIQNNLQDTTLEKSLYALIHL